MSMKHSTAEVAARLTRDEFPRSARYDPLWMLENLMGPNPLWLAESLSQIMDLEPDTRVMDLGCGKALTSIFLAKEFHLQVWATDLWVSASDNWLRIRVAKREQQVFPIYAEAHSLPFAKGFFDAIVSFDAYHYFGTDDLYLGYISQFVRPGGSIAIVVPGVVQEVTGGIPTHLAAHWKWDWYSFHSPSWWKQHWDKTGLVEVQVADMIPNGWEHWLRWLEVCQDEGFPAPPEEINMLRSDAGRTLGFTRVVARRK